jgi:hypothetical protein
VPQLGQNRAPSRSPAPHETQVPGAATTGVPQSVQNFAPGRSSAPQEAQTEVGAVAGAGIATWTAGASSASASTTEANGVRSSSSSR